MIVKKIVLGLFIASFLGGCTSPTAMLAPAYTFSSSGNILQTGLSYGSNQLITKQTGKSPIENIKEISSLQKNIKKSTLESEEFHMLVRNKIEKTNSILKASNQ